MDLWDLTRLLLRRWYFAVPMLLVSVAAVVGAAMTVSPDYKAMGYMQMIPAPSSGKPVNPNAKPKPSNPWLDLGYAALGNAAALSVTDTAGLEQLARDGYSDSVTVVLNERTPLFEIEAVGNSKAQATETVQHIVKLLQDDIADKQAQYGALPEDTITTLVINDGSTPEQESGKVRRVLIVAAGLGFMLTTASTIALDYWLRRRARRKASSGTDEEPPSSGSAAVPVDRPTPGPAQTPAEAPVERPDSVEQTQILRPQPLPRQNALVNGNGASKGNGNVYSSERHPVDEPQRPEPAANGAGRAVNGRRDRGSAVPPAPADVGEKTVVLPPSHPSRRGHEKRK